MHHGFESLLLCILGPLFLMLACYFTNNSLVLGLFPRAWNFVHFRVSCVCRLYSLQILYDERDVFSSCARDLLPSFLICVTAKS